MVGWAPDSASAPALSFLGSRSPCRTSSIILPARTSFMRPGLGSASSLRHASSSAADIAVIISGPNAAPPKYGRMGIKHLPAGFQRGALLLLKHALSAVAFHGNLLDARA